VIVAVDPRYFRPTEVETLLGDPSDAEKRLGWKPRTTFKVQRGRGRGACNKNAAGPGGGGCRPGVATGGCRNL
jgi:hypothetical protein